MDHPCLWKTLSGSNTWGKRSWDSFGFREPKGASTSPVFPKRISSSKGHRSRIQFAVLRVCRKSRLEQLHTSHLCLHIHTHTYMYMYMFTLLSISASLREMVSNQTDRITGGWLAAALGNIEAFWVFDWLLKGLLTGVAGYGCCVKGAPLPPPVPRWRAWTKWPCTGPTRSREPPAGMFAMIRLGFLSGTLFWVNLRSNGEDFPSPASDIGSISWIYNGEMQEHFKCGLRDGSCWLHVDDSNCCHGHGSMTGHFAMQWCRLCMVALLCAWITWTSHAHRPWRDFWLGVTRSCRGAVRLCRTGLPGYGTNLIEVLHRGLPLCRELFGFRHWTVPDPGEPPLQTSNPRADSHVPSAG